MNFLKLFIGIGRHRLHGGYLYQRVPTPIEIETSVDLGEKSCVR